MKSTSWYRKRTWTEQDRADFNTRLKRSRHSGNKAQYLRIQAVYLAEAGHHEIAIELLDRMFAEFPERIQLAQAHAQKANSLAKLGQPEAAIIEYRAALQAERNLPNVQTQAWLDFGWFVVEKELTDFYGEAQQVLQEFRDEKGLKFPASEYRYYAIQSLLANARGERAAAREYAMLALTEAAKKHSGLRYHPTVGLVGSEQGAFDNRLKALAAS
jgi:tetratricopeptide (TPR) repeat protein